MNFRFFGKPIVYNSMMPQGQTFPVNLGLPTINISEMDCFSGAPDPCLITIKCVSPVLHGFWGNRK